MSKPSKAKQPPSVGRVVHFHRPGTTVEAGPVAAIVVGLLPPPDDQYDAVQLFIMDPVLGTGQFTTACYSAEPSPGKWSYPPYVPPAIVEQGRVEVEAASLDTADGKPTVPPPAPDDSNAH